MKRKAKQRLVTQEASAIVAQYVHAPLDDPATELLTVAAEFVALKTELGRRSAELSAITATDRHGAEQISAILGAYQASLVQVSDVLVKINRLSGMSDRTSQLDQGHAANVSNALINALADIEIGLDHEQQRAVKVAFSEELTKLYE